MSRPENVILVVKERAGLLMYVLVTLVLFTTADVSARPYRLQFHTIGVNEGLSHNSVYALLQDSRGFIWAGTAEGLNRYDGRTIKTYRSPDAEKSADAGYIRDRLTEDREGNIWYVTYQGIYCWDKRTEQIKQVKRYAFKSLSVFFLSKDGDLWMLDLQEGMSSYNVYTGKMTVYPYPFSFDNKKFRELKITTNDADLCWFSMYGNDTYYQFDLHSKRYKELKHNGKLVLLAYLKSRLWLSSGKQIDVCDVRGYSTLPSIAWKNKTIVKADIIAGVNGELWLSSYGDGLYHIDEHGTVLQRYAYNSERSNALSSDNITTMIVDRSGNLWIGTDGGGISRTDLKTPGIVKFPQEEKDHTELVSFFTWALYEDSARNVWFATEKGALNIYDPVSDHVQQLRFPQIDVDAHIQVICRPLGNDIWIGYTGGVGYVKNGQFTSVALQRPSNYSGSDGKILVYKITARDQDTIIASTSAGLKLLVRKNGKWEDMPQTQEHVFYNRNTDIVAQGPDNYWLVFPNKGLYLATWEKGWFKVKDSFLTSETVRTIHRDGTDDNILWMASKTGLWRMSIRERRTEQLNTRNGLANANIYGILEDTRHNLWMSTNGGISCYDRTTKTFVNYDHTSGLQSNEFNSGAFHKGASGNMYFGGVKGFNILAGDTEQQHMVGPGIIITGIIAGDTVLSPFAIEHNTIELSYKKNSISISAVVPDYTRPEANYIRYELVGWDKQVNTITTGEIHYSNLPPGDYVLKLYGVGSNKVVSAPYLLNINVVAPFWQQVWFKLLLLLMAVGIIILAVYLAYRQKIKKALRELEQQKILAEERNRISRDLHDEIGSAITKISLISELIPLQQKGQEKVLEDVKAISATAREVSQSMSEIVWALHAQHDTLESLLSYLREQIREFLSPMGIHYELDFPDDIPLLKISGEQRRNILLVTKEALNNAVKYAEASIIRIYCVCTADRLSFKVEDDGKGFDATHAKEHGNGLKNMKRRMEHIGGHFSIIRLAQGTSIEYSIPV